VEREVSATQPLGGFNSGNGTTKTNITTATGGGGASDVRVLNDDYFHRIIVAGGGGGQGNTTGTGGHGGGLIGQDGQGSSANVGMGGTQSAPGVYPGGGDNKPATFGEGSDGPAGTTGGQGGGGWYGGSFGTRTNGGGAGGSGYVLTSTSYTPTGYFSAFPNYFFTNTVTARADESGFVPNPDLAGNGKVYITELCSFLLTASSSGTVNPATLCSGTTLTITTNAISNYLWSTGATTNSIVVAPTTNTVYSLTAMSPSNCMTTANLSVIVSSGVPVLTLAATPASVCVGDSVKLNATGAISYTWSNGVNNNQLFPPAQTSTYVVTGKNGCGTSTAAITVTALPLPVSISGAKNSVCAGSALSLTVTGATNYTWSTAHTTSVIVVAPTSATTYSVVGKKGSCTNTSTYSVSVNPLPVVQLTGSSMSVCAGNAVTLTASGGNNYTWTPSTLVPVGSSATDTPTGSVNYQVTGDNSFGCTSMGSHVVLVKPTPTITINSSQLVICPDASVTLTAGGSHTYSWNTGDQTKSLVVNPTTTTSYTATGTFTDTGCQASKSYTVKVDQPTLSATPSQTVCPGTALTLSASGSGQTWSNGQTNMFNSVTVTTPTMYSVTSKVLTANNLLCQASETVTLGMHAKPVVAATATRTEICRNERTILTASGADTYVWMNTNQSGSAHTFSSNIINTNTVSVIGTDVNGCKDTAAVVVKVSLCTGLGENGSSSLLIYPNPSVGKFTVKSENDIVVQIVNELGQVLIVAELNEQNERQIEISDLPKGIYFIQGENKNGRLKHKLLVE
jgi:hypothetical protein